LVDIEEVYVRDLSKKYKGRPEYKGLYSIGKKIHQDDGEIYNEGFAIDKENLRILKARLEAMFIDETKSKKQAKALGPNKSRQTKLP
jgi:hypothetical protein